MIKMHIIYGRNFISRHVCMTKYALEPLEILILTSLCLFVHHVQRPAQLSLLQLRVHIPTTDRITTLWLRPKIKPNIKRFRKKEEKDRHTISHKSTCVKSELTLIFASKYCLYRYPPYRFFCAHVHEQAHSRHLSLEGHPSLPIQHNYMASLSHSKQRAQAIVFYPPPTQICICK